MWQKKLCGEKKCKTNIVSDKKKTFVTWKNGGQIFVSTAIFVANVFVEEEKNSYIFFFL